jgi:hypothetical protein
LIASVVITSKKPGGRGPSGFHALGDPSMPNQLSHRTLQEPTTKAQMLELLLMLENTA